MKRIDHAVILAAGRGLRLMPLTSTVPKPMAKLWGNTLLELGVSNLRQYVRKIHVTVGYKGAILADHAISIGVDSIINTSEKGNAWWISNSLLSNYDSPVLVNTCDNIAKINFKLLEEEYFSLGAPACMLVPVPPVEGFDGDFIVHDNNYILQLSRNSPTNLYCSGIQVLNPARITAKYSGINDFGELWSEMIVGRELMCSNIMPLTWIAVDTLEQLSRLNGA